MEQPTTLEQAATAYIPEDWRQALARGETLPEQTRGTALFADISGFTPLSEALTQARGLRLGAEELTRHLNQVYDALIACVDCFGGSVVGFAGDAITCWFDAGLGSPNPSMELAAHRAVSCAIAMQDAMRSFPAIPVPDHNSISLAVKISLASGSARRFFAGDPEIKRCAVLCGDTIVRMAAGEHLAGRDEVLVDESTALAVAGKARLAEWRESEGSLEGPPCRFAVVDGLGETAVPVPWPELPPGALAEEQLRPWLQPGIYERLKAGLGEFLTEMRPVTILFLRFTGIDFECDPQAGQKLDAFINWVQHTLVASEGVLLDIIVGDKGSYLYAAYGVPIAHEDDTRRAVVAALVLRQLTPELEWVGPLQIGISQGTVRTGAYGSSTRRTYGVLGDDVNLAARLMNRADPGEVLISNRLYRSVSEGGGLRAAGFNFEPRPPVQLKGKAEPLPVFAVSGSKQRRAIRLQEPSYALPMIGRQTELHLIETKIDLAMQCQGQVVGISAEAGMGKSRMVAEVIRLARRKGFTGYGGACQSEGTNTAYLVWGTIWGAIFDLDPDAPARRQIRNLEGMLEDYAPDRVEAMPLLGPLLGLAIPENDFTAALEPRSRRSALEALLIDCLRASAREAAQESGDRSNGGLLLVLEDTHWIDPASTDLLEKAARAIANLPVLILLAYRPYEMQQPLRVDTLPYFTEVPLEVLSPADADQAVRAKLSQLYPEWRGAVPIKLIERIFAQSEGNPFYAEELLNYLHDQDLDLRDPQILQTLELPSSLHALILSRIDQLSARQQMTLKVASIIGRMFRFDHLRGYYPILGEAEVVRVELGVLARLDLTPLDTTEAELTYLFRHIITHEVAYENLPAATRAALHEQYARYLEEIAGEDQSLLLDALAYHYEQSNNLAKKREYLRRAGEAAAARYANVEAIAYLTRALAITPEDDLNERYQLHAARERVLDLRGMRDQQRQDLEALEALAQRLDSERADRQVQAALRRAGFCEQTGDFAEAARAAQSAIALAQSPGAQELDLAEGYMKLGSALMASGDFSSAEKSLAEALAGLPPGPQALQAIINSNLGIIYASRGDMQRAETCFRQGLATCEQVKDEYFAMKLRNNLGLLLTMTGAWPEAIDQYTRALEIARRLGSAQLQGSVATNMGMLYTNQGAYTKAQTAFEQSLEIARLAGLRELEISNLCSLCRADLLQGDRTKAAGRLEEAFRLTARLEVYLYCNELHSLRAELHLAEGQPQAALEDAQKALALARENELMSETGVALRVIGQSQAALGQIDLARGMFEESVRTLEEANEYECARTRLTWGTVLLQCGEKQQGVALLNQARETFARLGAQADLEAVQALLNR